MVAGHWAGDVPDADNGAGVGGEREGGQCRVICFFFESSVFLFFLVAFSIWAVLADWLV